MNFRLTVKKEFTKVKNFYWNLIDIMKDEKDKMGYEKGSIHMMII